MKRPNSAQVAVAWLNQMSGLGAPAATTRPSGTSWSDTGFVVVSVVGSAGSDEVPWNAPILSLDFWAVAPGSDKPPYNMAAGLAQIIRDLTRDNPPVGQVATAAGYQDARVQSVWPLGEPRRIPDPDGSFAHYSLDMGMAWVAEVAETPAGAQLKVDLAIAAEVARVERAYLSRREASYLARGAVMFSLDDGRAQNADLVALHETYGQKVTLGVVSDWVDDPGRLTSAQVLDFHNRGHEIANHSTTHANYTTITAAQRATESDTCSDFIEALTGVRPESYIYPQGGWNVTTDRELYGRFRSWAATLSPTTNLPPINRLGDTFPRYYRVDLDQVANLDRALELVRLAARAPVVIAFYTHWTDQPGTMTTAQYQSIAQLAYDLNVPAVLPRDMYGGFSSLADSSFEVPGLPNWIQSVTGSSAVTAQVADTPDAGIAGTKAVSLTATSPDTAYRSQAIWCQPNTTYRISGRLRCPSGNLVTNDVAVRVRWRLADETAISTASVLPAISGTGWTRFEGDLTSPTLARMALVDCYLAPAAGRGGTAYLDHLDIRPAEQGGLG